MKFPNFLIVVSNLLISPMLAAGCYTVDDAAKKGLIKYIFKSKGGYTGKVIELKIENLTDEMLDLKIEAGRRLDSKVDAEQDILVTQAREYYVNAKSTHSFNVTGMCCQAHNSAPTKGNVYGIGAMAADRLVKLACFLDKNNLSEDYAAQEAVWTVSNNNSLASIESNDTSITNKLQQFVSSITGRSIPKYHVTYAQSADHVADKITKVDGVFTYSPSSNGHITIGIYDASGKLIQLLFQDITHERGECKLYFVFNTKDLPEGTYFTRMTNNGMVEKEEKIEI